MRVVFGSWTPDQPDLGSAGLEEAAQCVPNDVGYGPYRAAEIASGATTLSGSVAGAFAGLGLTKGGNYITLVGTREAVQPSLYQMSATVGSTPGDFKNVSRVVPYNASVERWSMTIFGGTMLAVNGFDTMQVKNTLSAPSGAFNDQSASASAPVSNVICNVRDFVFADDTTTADKVQWCQINNPRRWTPNPRLQSDSQVLAGSGIVQQMTGGDFAAILTTNSVWRGSYVGSPLIFRFDEVAPGVGTRARKSVARFQNLTFFLSHKGFTVFDGQSAIPIGAGKIDDFFVEDANIVRDSGLPRISSAIDPFNSLYIVSYPSAGNTTPDRLLMYHWPTQRWARASLTTEHLCEHGVYLSGDLTHPRGVLAIVGFDTTHRLTTMTGAVQTATFITGEAQIFKDRRAFVQAVRPLVQAGAAITATTQIGKRNRLDESVTYTSAVAMNANGLCPVRADARYHRGRLDISSSFTHAIGLDLTAVPSGQR